MDIYLRIEQGDARGGTLHLGDVVLRVEPSHTIGDVRGALVEYFAVAGSGHPSISRSGLGLSFGAPGLPEPLDASSTVVKARLVTGQTLILGTIAPPTVPPSGGAELVIASGPDPGGTHPLVPGATVIVGRAPECDLALTDPKVSRNHLMVIVDTDGVVSIEALPSARNEVRVDGEPIEGSLRISAGQIILLGSSTLVVRPRGRGQPIARDAFGNIAFHRTPYFTDPVRTLVVEAIKEVPSTPEKARFAYLSAVAPLLIGMTFAMLFGPRYLLFALFSPVMLVANHIEQRRRSGRKFVQSVDRFHGELEDKTVEVAQALATERRRRFDAAPDLAALADRAAHRSPDLWVRDGASEDFLTLRVGLGEVPTALDVRSGAEGDVEFRDRIGEALGRTESMCDVPVTLDLAELGVVGLVGSQAQTTALASSLVVQACCLHSPEDLVVVAAITPDRAIGDWLKWSPHTRSAGSPLAGAHLVDTAEDADALIAALVDEVARRLSTERSTHSSDRAGPWLLVLLDRALEPDASLVSRLLDACPKARISVLWLTESVQRVPRQSQAIINCRSPMSGRLSSVSFTDPDRQDRGLDVDGIGPEYAATIGRSLAPLRDASLSNGTTAIPRTVPLFNALGTESVDVDWVIEQWRTDHGYALPTPIGFSDSGPLELDLVEHGPHGLIGGTSGAGKSELVMSMVAGLIARNPPTKVNFLFIDYKGGASSDLFATMAHTVGYVTNLDGLLAIRALTSLRAELNRRMNLLQGRAKDLAEMVDRYPAEAPPSLVIVVDEFATLVKEIPDFVTGIVDLAQRGRSLGIHLLLATQRPSGSVNDNIKANTNLRISLRMLDGADSSAVVGTTEAAAIPGPLKGRGYVRIGSSEPTAFQSAWAGAPLLADSGRPPVAVYPFVGTGLDRSLSRSLDTDPRTVRSVVGTEGPESRTQVQALLAAAVAATERLEMAPGRPPWLETLPPVISIDRVRDRVGDDPGAENAGISSTDRRPCSTVSFGMIDAPAAQAQYPAVLDLASSGGLIVSGTGGSGKSTVLRTVAISAAIEDSEAGGGNLTIFGIDFTSRGLGSVDRLPQCAAVATGDDLEAVTRIIALLHTELERRRKTAADRSYGSEPACDEPTVLLLIDGMDALVQAMEHGPAVAGLAQAHADLMRIVTEGRQARIFPIIGTARSSAIRAGISSAVSARLTLRQSDAQGYIDCGVGSGDAKDLELTPGQGFFDGSNLIQVATLTEGSLKNHEVCRAEVDSATGRLPGQPGREPLAELAETLTGWVEPRLETRSLPVHVDLLAPGDVTLDPLQPVVGLADNTTDPFILDLRHDDVSVIGDPRSGRSTVLVTVGRQVAKAGVEVWALGRSGSPLQQLSELSRSCFEEGAERQRFLEESLDLLASEPEAVGSRLLLLDDYEFLPENDRALTSVLEQLLGAVRFVAVGPKPRGFSASPIAQLIKGCRSLVYLRPHEAREAHEVLGLPVPWHPGLAMVEGRGIIVVDRTATMVQFSDPFFDHR